MKSCSGLRRHSAGVSIAAFVASLALVIDLAEAAGAKPVAPVASAIPVPDLAAIGRVESVVVRQGNLYVGGSTGVAAIDAGGKLLWTTTLPEADARALDADANGVAFTSFNMVGYERGKGVVGALLWGNASVKLNTTDSQVGLLSLDGKLAWSVAVDEPSTLSPPALGASGVAVQADKALYLYRRNDGSKVAAVDMFTNWLGLSKNSNTRVPVTRPLWLGDAVFAGHQSWFKKVSAEGKQLLATKELDRNFTSLMSGPEHCGDVVVLSEAAYPEGTVFTGKKARVYAANADGKHVWHGNTEDDEIGVGDLVCNDTAVFAVANAMISAFSLQGKELWQFESKKGSLIPGTVRGIGLAGTLPIARAHGVGRQAVATGRYLYVTVRGSHDWKGKTDVLAVLDVEKGSIVEEIGVNSIIVDMAAFGSDLAIVTAEGLKLIAQKN